MSKNSEALQLQATIAMALTNIATEVATLAELFKQNFQASNLDSTERGPELSGARGSHYVPPNLEEGRLFTRKEAADVVQMSETWIKRQIKDGYLAKVSLGKAVRIEADELRRFIQARKSIRVPGKQ